VAPEAEALEAEALEEVRRTHYLAPAKMATYLLMSHLRLVRGDRPDCLRLAHQSRPPDQEVAEILEVRSEV
jgi:hypothetical protein